VEVVLPLLIHLLGYYFVIVRKLDSPRSAMESVQLVHE
jgi:hypothetical protein